VIGWDVWRVLEGLLFVDGGVVLGYFEVFCGLCS